VTGLVVAVRYLTIVPLPGTAPGRANETEITAFDSTGLAIQDLAVALAAIERVGKLPDLPRLEL